MAGQKYRWEVIQNTQGGPVMMPDLGKGGFTLGAGKVFDLTKRFTAEEVNGSTSLDNAINKLKWVKPVESSDEVVKVDSAKLIKQLEPGRPMTLPDSPYIGKVTDLEQDEEYTNLIQQRNAGTMTDPKDKERLVKLTELRKARQAAETPEESGPSSKEEAEKIFAERKPHKKAEEHKKAEAPQAPEAKAPAKDKKGGRIVAP